MNKDFIRFFYRKGRYSNEKHDQPKGRNEKPQWEQRLSHSFLGSKVVPVTSALRGELVLDY